MKKITQHLPLAVLLTILFAACSRPVAYFQKSPREQYTAAPTMTLPTVSSPKDVALPVDESVPAVLPITAESVTSAGTASNQDDALATITRQSAADKSLQKRMNRVRTLLASASVKVATTSPTAGVSRKASLVERLMVKKMNRKINRQLAPENPNKPMLNTGILATGAVLVLIGLLLLLLTSGTASTVGIIVLLAGAVLLLVGLL